MINKISFTCPVCGYNNMDEPAYDKDGCASYGICPSCGTEFGYDDSTKEHSRLRDEWKCRGMKWWSNSTAPPNNWDAVSQLKKIEFDSQTKVTKGGKGITNPNVVTLAKPARPAGMTQSLFGKDVIGWGSRPQGALDRMTGINPSSVAKMKEQGLTREMAKEWSNFYSNEFSRNANNATAANRVLLMDKILNNFQRQPMTTISSLKFTNSSEKSIKLILEPWADEYDVLAGMTVDISASSPNEVSIEVEYEGENIIVYGWGEEMSVLSDGEKLEPRFD